MSSHGHTHNPYKTTSPATRTPQNEPANISKAQQHQQNQQHQQHQQNQQQDTTSIINSGAPQPPNLLNVPEQYHELTLHKPLIGQVSFVPYPKTQVAFRDTNSTDPTAATEEKPRIFIGQLPYGITEMQLQWMTQILGGGVTLYDPEVIVKNGKKTGCVHARVRDSQLKQLVAGMHKRVLVDDSGIWVGRTEEEITKLTAYVAELKADAKKRYPDRPYDTVVVQKATSERQQFHQGLPTLEDYFAQQTQQFAGEHGMYHGNQQQQQQQQ